MKRISSLIILLMLLSFGSFDLAIAQDKLTEDEYQKSYSVWSYSIGTALNLAKDAHIKMQNDTSIVLTSDWWSDLGLAYGIADGVYDEIMAATPPDSRNEHYNRLVHVTTQCRDSYKVMEGLSESNTALLLAGNSDLWASKYRKAWDLLMGCATDFIDAGEPYDDLLDSSTATPKPTATKKPSPTPKPTKTATPAPTATGTPPTATPTIALTPTPQSIPGTILQSSNIRSGPGTSYKIVGAGKPGQEVNIYEISTDKNWYRIGKDQWIATLLVDAG